MSEAVKRGVRTAVQAFVAVYGVPQLLAVAAGTSVLDVGLLRAAGVAAGAAVVAYLWNRFLDPSPIPSLD